MKITALKVWRVDLPLREGRYSWSHNNFVEVFDSTVIALETDEGIKEAPEAPGEPGWVVR